MFGQRVKQLREGKGWTQQELADRTGLDQTTISAYEIGRSGSQPSYAAVRALARAFDMAAEELVADPEPEAATTP